MGPFGLGLGVGEAVELGAGLDDGSVEGAPVDDGRAEPGIGERLRPPGNRLVGGDRDVVLLLPLDQALKHSSALRRSSSM